MPLSIPAFPLSIISLMESIGIRLPKSFGKSLFKEENNFYDRHITMVMEIIVVSSSFVSTYSMNPLETKSTNHF
jgi:hypothetical protein